ncbi:MAG: hypothetical protein OK456_08345 [Thaumarchaeota archaeon]|nr:hypothetical protein [Nitrososphaerota archaeon]
MVSLYDLQVIQRRHDKRFRGEVFALDRRERFKHVAFECGEHSARLARLVKGGSKGERTNLELQEVLVDSVMTTLRAAEIFDLDLEKELRRIGDLGETGGSFQELVNLAGARWRHDHPWTKAGTLAFATGLLLDSTDYAGVLHEASDSGAHVGDSPNETVVDAILNLLVVSLVSGDALGLDYEKGMRGRWRELEKKASSPKRNANGKSRRG